MLRKLPKFLNKDIVKLTPKNIYRFYTGTKRLLEFESQETHIKEQFYYRVTLMNKDCIKNKMCPCKCEFPSKQMSDEPCDKACYTFMMEKEIWNNFKLSRGIDVVSVIKDAKQLLTQNGF